MTTRTILLVDDDDDLRQILVEQLSLYEEFSLLQESNATRAMQTAKTAQVDLMIMDVGLPDMDGMALTRQIRQQFPAITARMPIIALTANTNPVERQRCLDAGMDDVLDKPMDLQTLVRSVSRHVLKARS